MKIIVILATAMCMGSVIAYPQISEEQFKSEVSRPMGATPAHLGYFGICTSPRRGRCHNLDTAILIAEYYFLERCYDLLNLAGSIVTIPLHGYSIPLRFV